MVNSKPVTSRLKARILVQLAGLFLASLSLGAQAGVAMFNVGSANGNPGDTVQVPLDFAADGFTANFVVDIMYDDTDLLVSTGMCSGTMLGGGTVNCLATTGMVTVQIVGNTIALPNGPVGVLEFTIDPSVNPGSNYPLSIGFANFTDGGGGTTTGMANPGNVSVNGGPAVLDSTPPPGGQLSFGQVLIGESQMRSIQVRNLGGSPLILSNENFTASGASDLSLLSSFPINIPPAAAPGVPGTASIDFRCDGVQAGENDGTLTFDSNDQTLPAVVYEVNCEVVEQAGGFVLIKTNGDEQSGNLGQELPVSLQVQLFQGSNTVGGQTINWNVTQGDATFVQSGSNTLATVTGTSGRSSANLQIGNTPGDIVIEASSPISTAVTFTATALDPNNGSGGNPNQGGGDGQTGMSGDTTDPLIVVVTDDDGMPVDGANVDWQVTGGDATLGMGTTITGMDGSTSNTVTFGDMAGPVTVTATVQNGGTTTFTLNNTGTGSALILAVDPSMDTVPITTQSGPFRACLTDANGAPIRGATLSWQIVGGDASVPGQTTTGGVGCSNNTVTVGNTPGLVTLQVSAGGAPDVQAMINAFAPTIAPVSGDGQTGEPGDTLAPFVIQIGQPGAAKALSNVQVTWTIVEGDGSLAAATTSTLNNGRSSNTYTLGASSGTSRIRATVPGMGSFEFSAVAKDPIDDTANFTIVDGNGQILPTNVLSDRLEVELTDSSGAPIAGAQINWSISPSDQASFVTEATTFTGNNGRSSNTAQIIIPDAYIITAQVEGTNLSVQFNLSSSVSNTAGLTDIQASVGAAIDIACPNLAGMNASDPDSLSDGQSDLLGRCTEIVLGSGIAADDVGGALDAMATEEATAQGNRAVRSAEAQLTNLKGRLLALRSGAKVQAFQGLTFSTPDGSLPASALAALLSDDNSGSDYDPGFSKLGFFITGNITTGDRDDTANEVGFDFDTYGLTAGLDYRFTDQLIMGAAIGYNNTDTDLSDGLSTLDADGYSFSGYGSYFTESGFYFDGIVTFGDNDYVSRRAINYDIMDSSGTGMTQVSQFANGRPGGDMTSASFSFGKDFQHESMTISPYFRYSFTDVDIDAYQETIADPNAPGSGLALALEQQTIESSIGTIGGQISWAMSRDWGVLLPAINIEYEHEFDDDPRTITARFVNDPTSTPFFVVTDDPDRNYFNVGFGFSAIFTGGKTAFLFYEGVYGLSEISQHSISAGFRFEF